MIDKLAQRTGAEWRTLGFYYDLSELNRRWTIRGSRSGLGRLVGILREYAQDPTHAELSAHEHYGPYSYLKLTTSPSPKIDSGGVFGRPSDFERLACIIEKGLAQSPRLSQICVDIGYSEANEADLLIEIESDDFDPAGADPAIQ